MEVDFILLGIQRSYIFLGRERKYTELVTFRMNFSK